MVRTHETLNLTRKQLLRFMQNTDYNEFDFLATLVCSVASQLTTLDSYVRSFIVVHCLPNKVCYSQHHIGLFESIDCIFSPLHLL